MSDGAPRDEFASAVADLEPFFDPALAWSGGHLEHFAYRAVRELRPELTVAQAYVIVVAARRVYATRWRITSVSRCFSSTKEGQDEQDFSGLLSVV
jgi:hypothetical protein